MPGNFRRQDRIDLLADVAEMYYLDGESQAEISTQIGVTRSMVSRMLIEARDLGIVKIQIDRPLRVNHELAELLCQRFNLTQAVVVDLNFKQPLLTTLGKAAAKLLVENLRPNQVLGTSWGTAISATVDELNLPSPVPGITIVQLLGALGARIKEYDGLSIVHRLEEKLGGEGIYLNSPFLVEDRAMASALMESKGVQEALAFGNKSDLALLGIGTTKLEFSPYYLAGYVTEDQMRAIQAEGAIGDVCGIFFDINGHLASSKFQERTIGIELEHLLKIPTRIGVTGGTEKVIPTLGALRGGLINVLVIDSSTARGVLQISN
ncbi:MAG: sugar-binding transcriptional regulator [Anaerolineaceae bacterium]